MTNNQLIIRPFIEETKEDIKGTIRQSEDSLSIEVLTVDNQEVWPSIILYDNKDKAVYGATTRGSKIYLSNKYIDLADSVKITSIGYVPITFKIERNLDYKIIMKTRTKADYENFLNSNGNGFKVRVEENKISL